MKILGGAKRREKKDLLLPQSDEDDGMGVLKPIEILWKSQKKGEVGSLPLSSSTRLERDRKVGHWWHGKGGIISFPINFA
ncbi:uncharacterized protein LOC108951480 isoform X4 [Musa acuminata AAA Group]|uniref:uncharacterized protein LOC108951480 isoform X4 n=1 Tax=Musa acuminata AAA Group TaxID=214697 RepID=UPI0031DC52A3